MMVSWVLNYIICKTFHQIITQQIKPSSVVKLNDHLLVILYVKMLI